MDKKKVIIVGGGTAGLTITNHLQEYFDVIPQNMNFAIKAVQLENFLNSVGIEYFKDSPLKGMKKTEINKFVNKATVYLECWSTDERFEEAKRGVNVLVDTVRARKKAKSN